MNFMAIINIEDGKIIYKCMWGFLNPSVMYQITKFYNDDGSVKGSLYHERV